MWLNIIDLLLSEGAAANAILVAMLPTPLCMVAGVHVCVHRVNICYVQTVDPDNPWIACSICRSHKAKGIEHGFRQSSDTDVRHTEGCLCRHETV